MSEQLNYEITKDEQSQDFLEKRGIRLAHGLQNKEGEEWYPECTLRPRIHPTDCHVCLPACKALICDVQMSCTEESLPHSSSLRHRNIIPCLQTQKYVYRHRSKQPVVSGCRDNTDYLRSHNSYLHKTTRAGHNISVREGAGGC